MKLGLRETGLALGLAALSGACGGSKENPDGPGKTSIQSPEVRLSEETTRELCRQYALNVALSIQRQLNETGMSVQAPVIGIKGEAEKRCLRDNGVSTPPPQMFERSPSGSRLEHTY